MSDHLLGCGAQKAPESVRPRFEVADILRQARDNGHIDPRKLTPERAKVLRAICRCRTAELGGHADVCAACGNVDVSYNSCRNRHCPRCQWRAQEQWIQGRLGRLLDTHYFHIVFTLPGRLRPLAACNPREVYGLLLAAASQTLLELGRDEKRLGAELGITVVLHTWTRQLGLHPHVHCLVTGGGLSLDGTRWIEARQRYLFAVDVIGALFRGKFLAGLRRLHQRGKLRLVGDDFDGLIESLYRQKWVVYAKRPMGGPEQVIKYLGRYTHRVAISNNRILDIKDGSVVFRTRGEGVAELSIGEFARRFLLHVLPKGFVKIRHYGLFAAANIRTKWAIARQLRPRPDESEDECTDTPSAPSCTACGCTRLIRYVVANAHVDRAMPAGPTARGPPSEPASGAKP